MPKNVRLGTVKNTEIRTQHPVATPTSARSYAVSEIPGKRQGFDGGACFDVCIGTSQVVETEGAHHDSDH
jgi:hypothetical protein